MNPKPKPPLPGGEYTFMTDTGPQGVSPNATRVNLIPVGDGGPGPLLPRAFRPKKPKPLLPGPDEIAGLPRGARAAFAARCARRAAPLAPPTGANEVETVTLAAVAILRVAIDPRDLALIRRDFERVRWFARKGKWTDDTPVPADVFGPLWPGRTPKWARPPRETNEPRV